MLFSSVTLLGRSFYEIRLWNFRLHLPVHHWQTSHHSFRYLMSNQIIVHWPGFQSLAIALSFFRSGMLLITCWKTELSAFAATFCPKVLADASASSSGQTQTTGSATKGSGSSQTGSASSSLATAATGSSTATGSSATQSPNSAQSYQGSALEAVAISFFAVACGFLGLR